MAENSDQAAKKKRGPGRPFPKGKSGNPGGRRPVPAEVKSIFLAADEEAARTVVSLMRSADEAIALKASTYVWEANHGKPVQALQHQGAEGGPLVVEIHKLGGADAK